MWAAKHCSILFSSVLHQPERFLPCTRLKTHRLFQVDIDRREQYVVRPTMNKLSTMLFQVVTVEQCCNNMLTILFIVGRTTLFTPVDIKLEQVVDFLNFYACRKGSSSKKSKSA
jgi:hypothetical protein